MSMLHVLSTKKNLIIEYQYERATRFGVSRQGIAYALKKLKISRKNKPSNLPKPAQRHNTFSKLK